MSTYQISCTIGTTDPTAELGLEIYLDDQPLYNTNHVTHESLPLVFGIEEDEAEHELRFVMKGKLPKHTIVNKDGTIAKDANLVIDDLAFDEIELGQIFANQAVYTHNFNGSKDTIEDKFFNIMGCNGTVSLKFSTPIYLWLLETM